MLTNSNNDTDDNKSNVPHRCSGMIVQVCCETGFSRMNMIMTKTRNNLLVVTLDALLMLLINGPSLEPGVPSPTIELSELCKLGYAHWTKVKNRNPKRCQHVSRARRVDEPSALHHNVYRDAPAFRLFLHGDGADEGEEERSQGSQQEEVEEVQGACKLGGTSRGNCDGLDAGLAFARLYQG